MSKKDEFITFLSSQGAYDVFMAELANRKISYTIDEHIKNLSPDFWVTGIG